MIQCACAYRVVQIKCKRVAHSGRADRFGQYFSITSSLPSAYFQRIFDTPLRQVRLRTFAAHMLLERRDHNRANENAKRNGDSSRRDFLLVRFLLYLLEFLDAAFNVCAPRNSDNNTFSAGGRPPWVCSSSSTYFRLFTIFFLACRDRSAKLSCAINMIFLRKKTCAKSSTVA